MRILMQMFLAHRFELICGDTPIFPSLEMARVRFRQPEKNIDSEGQNSRMSRLWWNKQTSPV